MIECKRCRIAQPAEVFYRDPRTGHLGGICLSCRRAASRAHYQRNREIYLARSKDRKAHEREDVQEYKRRWNAANREKVRAYKTRHYEANRVKVRDRAREWERANPDRAGLSKRAARIVQKALRGGKLVRPDICEQSDETCMGRITAAHSDYSKPLDVRWLCISHHRRWDQAQPKTKPNNEDFDWGE